MYINEYMLVKSAENKNVPEIYRRAKGQNPINLRSWAYLNPAVAGKNEDKA